MKKSEAIGPGTFKADQYKFFHLYTGREKLQLKTRPRDLRLVLEADGTDIDDDEILGDLYQHTFILLEEDEEWMAVEEVQEYTGKTARTTSAIDFVDTTGTLEETDDESSEPIGNVSSSLSLSLSHTCNILFILFAKLIESDCCELP